MFGWMKRSDFVALHPCWLGWYDEQFGAILATRSNGTEALFANKDKKAALVWIPTISFMMEPNIIAGMQDIEALKGPKGY